MEEPEYEEDICAKCGALYNQAKAHACAPVSDECARRIEHAVAYERRRISDWLLAGGADYLDEEEIAHRIYTGELRKKKSEEKSA